MKIHTCAAILVLALAAVPAHAFCVYNKIDQNFEVQVRTDGSMFNPDSYKGFQKTVRPGAKECCHYSNKECNPSGKQTSVLTLSRYYTRYNGQDLSCKNVLGYAEGVRRNPTNGETLVELTLQAGGYLTLERNGQFKASKPVADDNAPYLLRSYSYDHLLVGAAKCTRW